MKKIKKKKSSKSTDTENKTCFIISPIGKEGTEIHTKFKDVYEYIIKPAVKNSGYDLQVIRADDINRPGSFIKDILENILISFVVIADLTTQNPNVFYELGVRHSLTPRTILIAQSLDDIPADLREYRTIIYENSAKGLSIFSNKLKEYFQQIFENPQKPDNPVLDRLGSIIENRTNSLEQDVARYKNELSDILKKGFHEQKSFSDGERIRDRMQRILALKKAERQSMLDIYHEGEVVFDEDGQEIKIQLTTEQSHFQLYFIMDSGIIADYWYVAQINDNVDITKELSDVRVLLEHCIDKNDIEIKFIIVTNDDLSTEKEKIQKIFQRMLTFIREDQRKLFTFHIWDSKGILEEEKKLGIKIDI